MPCLLASAAAARLAALWLIPISAISVDLRHWLQVGLILRAHGNPYAVTPYLNWPPFWLQLLFAILKSAAILQIPFLRLIQLFLGGVDLAVLAVAYEGGRRLFPEADLRKPLLWGLALNPALILLSCQHGNFDGLVAFWAVCFALALASHERDRRGVDWLLACLFLGLGVLTKTAPLILAPTLAPGWQRVARKERILGVVLALGPAALALSVLYVLSPEAVERNVLAYRSQAGYFGLTALPGAGGLYAAVAPAVLAAGALWVGRLLLLREELAARDYALACALLLALVPALGPGYAPQYLAWTLPLWSLVYAASGPGPWRRLLAALWGVAAATYLYEYAFFASHGAFAVRLWGTPQFEVFTESLCEPWAQALARLPLFAGYLMLLRRGERTLRTG